MKIPFSDIVSRATGYAARRDAEAMASAPVPAAESVADARAQAEAEGRAEGVEAERKRSIAILGMVEDFSDVALVEAAHAAVRDHFTVDQARAVLTSIRTHSSAQAATQKRMPGLAYCNGHDLGPDVSIDEPDAQSEAGRVLGLFSEIRGYKQ